MPRPCSLISAAPRGAGCCWPPAWRCGSADAWRSSATLFPIRWRPICRPIRAIRRVSKNSARPGLSSRNWVRRPPFTPPASGAGDHRLRFHQRRKKSCQRQSTKAKFAGRCAGDRARRCRAARRLAATRAAAARDRCLCAWRRERRRSSSGRSVSHRKSARRIPSPTILTRRSVCTPAASRCFRRSN